MQQSHQNGRNRQVIISNIDYRSLIMDKDGSLYVCDRVQNEVSR